MFYLQIFCDYFVYITNTGFVWGVHCKLMKKFIAFLRNIILHNYCRFLFLGLNVLNTVYQCLNMYWY